MSETAAKYRATVTHRPPTTALAPDIKERLTALQRQRQAEVASVIDDLIDRSVATTDAPPAQAPSPPQAQDRPKRDANGLQSAFLAENLGRPVTVYLLSGVKLVGKLRQYDQFTLSLQGAVGIDSLVFKHAIATLQPGTRLATR